MRDLGLRRRLRAGTAGTALALALASCAALAGCAGHPAVPRSVEPPPEARLELGEAVFLDQARLAIPVKLSLRNPGSARLRLESADCSVSVQGAAAGDASGAVARPVSGEGPGRVLEPSSGELELTFEASVDARQLDESVSGPGGPPRAGFSCAATAHLVSETGERLEARATAEGSFPIVREPIFRISSLKIERDILVTTNLRLELEVENPNDFPMDLALFAYRFYGEGASWAEGRFEGPVDLPARQAKMIGLAFEMNFADRDRKLLDLVAELKTLRYELVGKARASTGLPFLPAFDVAVDEEGSCQVER